MWDGCDAPGEGAWIGRQLKNRGTLSREAGEVYLEQGG